MAAIPYALSIHHFIISVGADAGFAAIIGLALLVLLFFSQARETAGLRRRADEAEDALHRLDAVRRPAGPRGAAPAPAQLAPDGRAGVRRAAVPAAAARPAPARAAAGRMLTPGRPPVAAMAMIPAAPAGVGAPALSAATRLIPLADDATRSRSAPSRSDSGRRRGQRRLGRPPPRCRTRRPAALDAAGGANGNSRRSARPATGERRPDDERARPPRVRAGAPRSPRRGRPAGPERERRTAPGRPARQPRRDRARRRALARGGRRRRAAGGHQLRRQLQHHHGRRAPRRRTTIGAASEQRANAASKARRHDRDAGTVTVAVLNGTSTNNLAHDVMPKLTAAGYKPGSIATRPTRPRRRRSSATCQPANRNDALAVAKSLKLGPASVQAVIRATARSPAAARDVVPGPGRRDRRGTDLAVATRRLPRRRSHPRR